MKFYNSQFFKKLIKLINSSKTGKEKERKRKLKSQHQNVTTNAAGTKRIGETTTEYFVNNTSYKGK